MMSKVGFPCLRSLGYLRCCFFGCPRQGTTAGSVTGSRRSRPHGNTGKYPLPPAVAQATCGRVAVAGPDYVCPLLVVWEDVDLCLGRFRLQAQRVEGASLIALLLACELQLIRRLEVSWGKGLDYFAFGREIRVILR